MDLRTDQALAEAYAAGDLDAFGALYDRHAAGVYAGACTLLGPGDPASAAVAASFQRLSRDIKRSRRIAAAPLKRLDRLARSEVRRRMHARGVRWIRRSTDGVDRTLPPRLRANVLSLASAPKWLPSRSLGWRLALGALTVAAIAVVGMIGTRVVRSLIKNKETADASAPGVSPALLDTPASTSIAVVLPPDPVIAAPVVVDPAAPAPAIALSVPVVDFGGAETTASVVLSNVSGEVQLWNVEGDPAPFVMAATPGALNPGETSTISFSLDRTVAVEGTIEVPLTIAGSVPQVLTVRADVNKAPQVALLRATPQLLFACTGGSIEVAASVTDDSAIASANISWIGPGAAGVAAMSGSGEWIGAITPQPIAGTWAYSVQAIDERGNAGAAVGTFQISEC